MISSHELIDKVSAHCKSEMKQSRCSSLPFHNWKHTIEVVANCLFISENFGLADLEREELSIVAYFHDMGQIRTAKGHETLSCYYVEDFLKQYHYAKRRVKEIQGLIVSTKMPHGPVTGLQKIICDADLAHLGKKCFFKRNEKLRVELEELYGKPYRNAEWKGLNVKFLREHRFHTDFAKGYYGPQKIKNLGILEEGLLHHQSPTP